MAKTKPDINAHAKKSITTNTLFKKGGKDALRQYKSRYMNDAVEKPTMATKSHKKYKPKHPEKRIPEHPMATEFAGKISLTKSPHPHSNIKVVTGSIEQSRDTITGKSYCYS